MPRDRAKAAALWPLASNWASKDWMSVEDGGVRRELLIHASLRDASPSEQMDWPDSYYAGASSILSC